MSQKFVAHRPSSIEVLRKWQNSNSFRYLRLAVLIWTGVAWCARVLERLARDQLRRTLVFRSRAARAPVLQFCSSVQESIFGTRSKCRRVRTSMQRSTSARLDAWHVRMSTKNPRAYAGARCIRTSKLSFTKQLRIKAASVASAKGRTELARAECTVVGTVACGQRR